MEELGYAFFVDFDGTITTSDVCATLVETFAGEGWQELNERWENKELSTLECARQTFKLFKTNKPEDFRTLADQAMLDPSFPDFLAFCRDKKFPIVILSDGYGYYIEFLLKREGLELTYYANTLLFTPELDIEAPYHSCTCDLCGVCKLELMQRLKKPAYKTVYIGDGYSDFCPAENADVVFAKNKLYQHCLKVGKNALVFESFQDILQKLGQILEGEPRAESI